MNLEVRLVWVEPELLCYYFFVNKLLEVSGGVFRLFSVRLISFIMGNVISCFLAKTFMSVQ